MRKLLTILIISTIMGGGICQAKPAKRGSKTEVAKVEAGTTLPSWSEGCLDIHFINSARGECCFYILPDGTTLLVDAGEVDDSGTSVPQRPNAETKPYITYTKTLRGSRMEDVIFGGTSQRKALGYAEVTLRLDNADRGIHSDKDEVSVTRRYYRSGESEYKINGEVCRLRDIHELFMDTGLGRDGYSMVGQGRIADLVSARSSQRRDMLEEAAGISHFRYRRADANRKLEQAEENLIRLRDILAELESRIGPLKTQSEKALKFLALAEEKKTLEIGLWLHTIEKSRNGLKEQEHKLSIATSQYEMTENELVELIEKIEAAIKEGQDITLEIERLRQTISESEEEAAVIEGKIAVERNTIEHNLTTIERISGDMGDSEQSLAETDAQIASNLRRSASMSFRAACTHCVSGTSRRNPSRNMP